MRSARGRLMGRRSLLAGCMATGALTAVGARIGAWAQAGATPPGSPAINGQPAAPAVHRAPEHRFAGGVDLGVFAPPGTDRPSTQAIQAALDAALIAAVPLRMPQGGWIVDGPLTIHNGTGLDRPMPMITGAGLGATMIEATGFAGPVLAVRGVGHGRLRRSHFLRGGGMSGFDIRGTQRYIKPAVGAPVQHGLEVLGWWGGDISNMRISRLTGDAMRAVGDKQVDANPDWTATFLRLRSVYLERVAGWAFTDENPIGAPGWSWSQCIFGLAGKGGARIRSNAQTFTSCAFNIIGFAQENTPSDGEAIALHLAGRRGWSVNRARVIGCEFDSSKDIHLALDDAHACFVQQTRFIINDRNHMGHPTPPVAVAIARAGEASACTNTVFEQSLLRIDTPGEATAFKWYGTANVQGIRVDGLTVGDDGSGRMKVREFEGHDAGNAHLRNDYRLRTARAVISRGRGD